LAALPMPAGAGAGIDRIEGSPQDWQVGLPAADEPTRQRWIQTLSSQGIQARWTGERWHLSPTGGAR